MIIQFGNNKKSKIIKLNRKLIKNHFFWDFLFKDKKLFQI